MTENIILKCSKCEKTAEFVLEIGGYGVEDVDIAQENALNIHPIYVESWEG